MIDSAQPPEAVELQKGISPSRFLEIENSGLWINPENEVKSEEDQLSEMGAGTHIGS